MDNVQSMLQTLSDTDENLLDDLLMLKYGISKDQLLENQEAVKDPNVMNILERSYYSQAKGRFTGGMQEYAAEENNLTPEESITESYRRQLKYFKNLILESMENPDDENEYIDKVKEIVGNSEEAPEGEDNSVQDDLIKQYYDNGDDDYVSPEVAQMYNDNIDQIEDLGTSDFLSSIDDLPDEQKVELANLVIDNMPIDDKIDLALDYLDNSDVVQISDEVADMADAISDDRLSREETGKAILSLVAEITDNPEEATEIISNLSDESIDLIGDYISSQYDGDEEEEPQEEASQLQEGDEYSEEPQDDEYVDDNEDGYYEDDNEDEEGSEDDSDFEYDSDSEEDTETDEEYKE